MPLYNEFYLKNLTKNQPLNESIKMFSEAKQKNTFDIFLSHSFLDQDAVKGLFIVLTRLGFSVYVDWIIDPQLDRKNVTKESAKLIQRRLRSCKCLLLAISENADLSRWIPWELGYVDGHTNLCALIPVANANSTSYNFERKEYLLLYPFVKKTEFNGVDNLWVIDSDDKFIGFDTWIRNGMP
ncbi:MAG: toll/interleukin-1 receptor domain-containing protein [Sphingobacterium sp.]|jgi:hypothetical protein|uniref:toll/interleukin-1 receptor domain-containing protein n=1 Tax=Sphingobacterium sp. TaxID=341027 RepID=UPI0028499B98|nr:toll/interleukin-1 receptor domain-containing protein [Sphingobacterium sp.]MDR3007196.1 toll/interleukin-1 receptor domain-containing protein [Sphingobacterium sp.]